MTLSKTCEYPSIIGGTNPSKQKSILVVGLGNTGKEYQNTRHNVGFIAIDYLSEYYKISWNTKVKFHAELAQGTIEGHKLLLAKPLTYMNLSGKAVQAICSYYNIKPPNIFVLHDDIDLETGRIKYKLAGGSGGHNGLKSLDQCVGNDYHRIRIGVGRPVANGDVSDYVLAAFSKEEYKIIVNSIEVIINNFHLLLSGEMEEFKRSIV
ncbi:aminoacyl-tRNA hydrolase [Candidatus Tisiphia endosymbiont of Oplodontha viridula]|uniref:aminoacyl-tRNA hydrolase n=1 Tax=Candidatus Tisiphia endosymbiont of Oplodontha viridula TaxID=3077925 RepID=UPI0035C8D030